MAQQLQGDIKFLSELQGLDNIIRKLEREKNTTPAEIIELRQKISKVEKELEEIEEELESLRKERRHNEMELDEKVEALNKYRDQKNQVKTNEAYSALLKEIQDVENDKSEIEESILIFMERGEELASLIDNKKADFAKYGEELASMEGENRSRVEQLDRELSKYMDERCSKASGVDADLLSRYERIRKAKDGLAFVSVRNNTCQGCFMELPPQVVSELMKGDRIVTCERCSRLLYWEGE